MSWMIKGRSSSALEPLPPHFPLSKPARLGVATTEHDLASAPRRHSVIDRWRRSHADRAAKSDKHWRTSEGVGTPLHEGIHFSEGFG
jgi:hypothetical protein